MMRTYPFMPFLSKCIAIAGIWTSICFAAPTQATYFVSPTGSDANPGTESQPFQTITKARDVVRTINKNMTGDILVTLRGGTYPLTKTISFGTEDGGSNGYYVRYINANGETPLITGGQPVYGWTIHDQAKNIWKATGISSRFRQLYINGKKGIRARSPNLEADGSHNFWRLTKVDTNGRALDVSSSYVSNWNNFDKVEMHLMIAWADATLRLASLTTNGSTSKLQIQDPEKTMLFNRPYPMLGATLSSRWYGDGTQQQCFYFENAYEFIDQAGEWYLDESTHTLYYKARPDENMATSTVVMPLLENLINITSTSTTNTVGYLAFQGLAFAHSTFMRPSQSGYLDLQAGQFNVASPGGNNYMLWRPAAGVTVTNAHHIRFERNLFSQMAATGLDFISGTHDDMIAGNVFTDLGGSGISIGKFAQDTLTEIHIAYNPTDKNEIATRDTIKNNLVTKVTTELQGAIGIAAGYPRNIVIEHNEVSYTNYSGISVGFGWTKEETAMTNNKINWNNIHHIAQLLADAGPIYTLSNQGSGSEIQYNFIHDIAASKWADYWIVAIYLDEGTSGYDVSHNVFQNAPSGVACNSCGTYTESDNNGQSATTIANAGIESAYSDIKNKVTLPLPVFANIVPQEYYKGIIQIPGTLEFENYDLGGQGVSYQDEDYSNQGGSYRADGVDIVGDSATGYKIGYTTAGEWLEYSVHIENAVALNWTARVSSGLDSSGFHILLDSNLNITDQVIIPNTSSWDTYITITGITPTLPAGDHVLKVVIDRSYGNLDWIQFSSEPSSIFESASSQKIPDWNGAKVYDIHGKQIGVIGTSRTQDLQSSVAKLTSQSGIYIVKTANGLHAKRIHIIR